METDDATQKRGSTQATNVDLRWVGLGAAAGGLCGRRRVVGHVDVDDGLGCLWLIAHPLLSYVGGGWQSPRRRRDVAIHRYIHRTKWDRS